MSNVIDFHPPLGKISAVPDPNDAEGYLCNIPMTIRPAKEAGTPQGDAFYRTYVAKWHGLSGQPLSDQKREETAFFAAAAQCGWKFKNV
jgi:hypothetical protein